MELLVKDLEISKNINEEWIKENCYIAGGACVSNFTGLPINDVDLYFKTKEAMIYFLEQTGYDEYYFKKNDELWQSIYYFYEYLQEDEYNTEINDIKYKLIRKLENINNEKICIYNIYEKGFYKETITKPLLEKQKWLFENDYIFVLRQRSHFEVNSDTFLGNKSITIKIKTARGNLKYQFILRFYGEPEEVMDKTFDFQHCKIAFDLKNRKYIANQDTFECLAKKQIKYINSFYPISSLNRLFKYKSRGFTYTNDEFIKIIKDIHNVNVDNKYILEDQLVGYYEDFDYNVVFNDVDPFLLF